MPRRTGHGENLDAREPGEVGWVAVRFFWPRTVWCPACGALPNRSCKDTDKDRERVRSHENFLDRARWLGQVVPKELRKVPYRHGSHPERLDRAQLLTGLARSQLLHLVVVPSKDNRQTLATFDGLALWRDAHGREP